MDSVYFKGLATGRLMMPPKNIWATQIGLYGFLVGFFLEGEHKDRRVNMGEIGIKYDQGALYKIPK